jgi:hypothetical protein
MNFTRRVVYFLIRITPTATFRCSCSGSFKRAFSAAAFVLNGFDSGVSGLFSLKLSLFLGV